ncbi:sensor histidine kinase [Croceivirga radicis]|uniref:sensor histidine kinase n=1 Tax=Croceivirga radicis TaxID=1929488 RepID=UPI000255B73E|nr:sensor histidine kinase [Croceivirga radicis]
MQQSVDENPPLTTKLLPLKAVNSVGFLVSIGLGVYYLVGGALLVPLALFVLALFFILNFWVAIQKEKEGPQVNELHKKLHEKEFLLKEVHHRVKNNLQTVSSLLSLQSRSIADKKIKGIIRSSQHRVVSMSMVHEMLYKRDDYTSKIEFKPYVEELCEYLIRSVKGNNHNIATKLNIGDYKLSIDTVIPLGLIINETITNALKYGIPGETEGEIEINLSKKGVNTYEMYLGDNGIGYPEEVSPKTSKSLGLKLIHNLSRQLRGTIFRDMEKKGTYYQITFEEIIDGINTLD